MPRGRVVVVDDDEFHRTLCHDVLSGQGFSVVTAATGLEGLAAIGREDPDIVITDLVMPDIGGLEVLERTKQQNALIDVVVITGHGSLETAVSALKKGAFDYITKPFHEIELIHTIKSCMEKRKLLEENQEMKQSLKLFEVSRAVAGTIEIERLYDITLDAMLQVLPAEAGLFALLVDQMTRLEIKAIRHMEMPEGVELVKALRNGYGRDLREVESMDVVAVEELKGKTEGYSSLFITPIPAGGPKGFLLLLSKEPKRVCSLGEMRGAEFLLYHARTAFENARKYADAQELIFIDSLTGLYNSRYLDKILEKEMKRAKRLRSSVTVLFMDLDNFKLINDRNDHLVGSRVLVEAAKVILKNVREVDTVVRYGGDEYVAILCDADYDQGFLVADRIRKAIEDRRFLEDEGLDIRVTVSIGVATYPVHAAEKKELIKIADKAMYRAKDISRNLVYMAPVPEGEPED